jgi:CHAT domain-containing protein/Flp pilus assembly protein TadD
MRYAGALLFFFLPYLLVGQSDTLSVFLEKGLSIAQEHYQQDELEKAILIAQQYLEAASTQNAPPHPALGNLYHKLGVYHYVADDYNAAQQAYEQAIRVRKDALGLQSADLSRSYHNLGVALKEKGNFRTAIDQLLKAVLIRRQLEDKSHLATSYQELGIVYAREGDYDYALEYHRAALQIFEETAEGPTYDIARTHQAMGIILQKKKELQAALPLLEKSNEQFIQLYGKEDPDVADCYNNIGIVYDDMQAYSAALKAYQEALSINLSLYGRQHPRVALNYNNLGFTHHQLGQYQEALSYHQKALAIRQEVYGDRYPILASSYTNIADVYVARQQYDQAQDYYRMAIECFFPGQRDFIVEQTPNPASAAFIGRATDLLNVLSSQADALQQWYDQSGEVEKLEQALITYHSADALIDWMRTGYESTESKLFLLEKALPLYQNAVQICWSLNELNPNDDLFKQAFRFAEKSKAVLLLAGIQESQARLYANIPDSLLQQETNFKADIAYAEQRLAEKQLNGANPEPALQEQLLQWKQDYQQFQGDLEAKFPVYHAEKYKTEVASIERLQRYLSAQNSSFVAYFFGETSLFVLQVSGEAYHWSKADSLPLMTDRFASFLRSLTEPASEDALSDFQQEGYELYRTLWAEVASFAEKRVVISPAGFLNYLPFDALLTESVSGQRLKKYPFLLHQNALSYAYSATVLLENADRTILKANRPFLGIAPGFEQSDRFSHLAYSQEEVKGIRRRFGGDVLLGAEATKQAFQEQAGQYRILHLSSHAEAVDSNRILSWIGFYDGDQKEESYKLYLNEIYALPLQAEMVVLSACETGSGQLSKGEGVMSLARGFAFAGCQSITTTLWSVNHGSTTRLMQHFYQAISEGQPKDLALQQAKIHYLESEETDQFGAHPYFWAGFVHIGDRSQITLSKNKAFLWLLFGSSGFLLFSSFLLWRKIKAT